MIVLALSCLYGSNTRSYEFSFTRPSYARANEEVELKRCRSLDDSLVYAGACVRLETCSSTFADEKRNKQGGAR